MPVLGIYMISIRHSLCSSCSTVH